MENWEWIAYNTYRLKVFGGWIVRYDLYKDNYGREPASTSLTFVPDKRMKWRLEYASVQPVQETVGRIQESKACSRCEVG